MVAGQLWVHISAPGVDPAMQTSDFLETVPLKVSGRIHAPSTVVIVDHEQIGPLPVRQNFLHEFLRKKMRTGQSNGVIFFARADVEQVNRFASREPF